MRVARFEDVDGPAIGIVEDDRIISLRALDPDAPAEMTDLMSRGIAYLEAIETKAKDAEGSPLSEVKWLVPVARPGKLVCLGLNYADHAREGGFDVPDYPALFMRAATSLTPHGAPIVRPQCSEKLDYEAELLVVIGQRCRHLTEANALDPIFGYSLFNDGSVRDYQRKTHQWTPGKNFDRTGGIGPWIVTADALPPGAAGLGIRSILGGEILQESNTSNMIFDVVRTMCILSEVMTLEPGDLIAMGTPEGVGHARRPPLWLKPGDEIVIEIDGIGRLVNPVVDEV